MGVCPGSRRWGHCNRCHRVGAFGDIWFQNISEVDMRKITAFAFFVFGLFVLAVPALAAILADIDHETGDLSQYDSVSGTTTVITPGLAYTSYKLWPQTGNSFGAKNFALSQSRLRLRLYFDPNGITTPDGEWHPIVIIDTLPSYAFRVAFFRNGSSYLIRPQASNDASGDEYGNYVMVDGCPHWIEVDYQVSSGTNNGFIKMWVDGLSTSPPSQVLNLDNDTKTIDWLVLGSIHDYLPVVGTIYIDEIVVNDTGDPIGGVSNFPFRLWLPLIWSHASR
jgi:hypothetical protein